MDKGPCVLCAPKAMHYYIIIIIITFFDILEPACTVHVCKFQTFRTLRMHEVYFFFSVHVEGLSSSN